MSAVWPGQRARRREALLWTLFPDAAVIGRRAAVAAAIAILAVTIVPAGAQRPASERATHVGVLTIGDNEQNSELDALRITLRSLGYSEGRNLIIDYRFAHGDYTAMPKLAAELVAIPVDIIVTAGSDGATRAAFGATRTIPHCHGHQW
jgi:putative ABC transport system substrate-binding protein